MDPGKSHFVLRETLRLPLKWIALEGLSTDQAILSFNRLLTGLDYRIFSYASDCWAFGVLMWEIKRFVYFNVF